MHHILGNKILEYDVDDRGVIIDEREIDRNVNPKPNIPAESIEVNVSQVILSVTQTFQLIATVSPEESTDIITYNSSDPDIATVSPEGLVTAISVGTTIVNITAGNINVTVSITVTDISFWIKQHMVFWYDMAKPVDVYIPGVTYANQFINDGGKIKYDSTINKCTITHTPTSANRNFWQVSCFPSSAVSSFKIRVTGLPQGFSIESGIYSTKITSDGEYDIPEYKNSGTTTRYPGFYLAGDNVNDADCNIVVEEIPTKQSVPTNEILKSNPYLQDFSGNNRPLKLNNFLFAAMSGVGGYDISSTNILPDRAVVTVTDNRIIHITSKLSTTNNMVNIVPSNSTSTHKFKVTGLQDGRQVSLVNRMGGFYTFDNGEHEVTLTYPEGTTSLYNAIGVTGDIGDMDVTIEFIPKYPNALVTDGVDDYGQVQNLSQGVKMLFYTCNNFRLGQQLYDQRKVGYDKVTSSYFSIFAESNSIAYNARNVDGSTYIDGVLNETIIADNLLEKKAVITIVNGSADSEKTGTPSFFSLYNNLGYFGTLAFYNSIGFDAVPTKETDGFTEQELINYVLENLITK